MTLTKPPKTYKAAMSSVNAAEWLKAIDTEIAALQQYKTWEVVKIPANCRLKTGAFIFKEKYSGETINFKARLVAHGYRQI